jgi:CubicO group peptidase (beta-lactamase class C family)
LLTFRSGLEVGVVTPQIPSTPLRQAMAEIYQKNVDDSTAWLNALAALPLAFQPGSAWAYHTSSDVLAVLVSRVSGMSFGDFLQRRIFGPLGMNDTGHFVPPEKRSRLAVSYGANPDTQRLEPTPESPGLNLPAAEKPPAFAKGGSGLISTVDDFLQFARMLLGHGTKDDVRILSHRTASLMITNFIPAEQRAAVPFPFCDIFQGQGWGLGLSVVLDPPRLDEYLAFASVGSFGYQGFFGTWWQADPKEEMIQIYMHQFPISVPQSPPRLLFDKLVYAAIND